MIHGILFFWKYIVIFRNTGNCLKKHEQMVSVYNCVAREMAKRYTGCYLGEAEILPLDKIT